GKGIGADWRVLNAGQQAQLVLVHLHKGETFAELATGSGVSASTACRYVQESVALPSARSPKLPTALQKTRQGCTCWFWTARSSHTTGCGPNDRTTRPAPLPRHERAGHRWPRRHDPVEVRGAARTDARPDRRTRVESCAGWKWPGSSRRPTRVIKGTEACVVFIPYKGRDKPESCKQANRSHAKLRGPGERANAQLKS